MIPISKSSPRGPRPVRLVVIHTAEGARTTQELARYFSGPVEASSHVGIDDRAIEQYLPYDRAAWTMLSANAISDQAELCGFAVWTREQWLGEHRGMLVLAAQWIRERCIARGIPIVKLTPAQVAAGEAGVCGHWDWTVGMHDGTHTDPGSQFPWDVVIAAAQGTAALSPPPRSEPDFMATMSDPEKALLMEAANSVLFGIGGVRSAGPMAMSVADVRAKLDALTAKVDAIQPATGGVDLDALAEKVVGLLAARLQS